MTPGTVTPGWTPTTIANAFEAACRAELASLKPGNVHVFADGHRMETAMFEGSAAAAAPFIAAARASVGQRIERAVAASFSAAGCNTNLGIVLLCAPLAAAAERENGPLRVRLDAVLDDLSIEDARAAFRAIARANPGGLGSVKMASVGTPPDVTLMKAMQLARGHDRIANAYVTDFADIFDFALPALHTARLSAESEELAITTLHMCLLDQFPDTHIARKFGTEMAHQVQIEAHRLRSTFLPAVDEAGFAALLAFDTTLKARGLNPGTTADFVVATHFADALLSRNRAGSYA